MNETAGHIAKKASDNIIEQGIMGSFVVLFFLTAAVLLWYILKDRKAQETTSNALTVMAENETKIIENQSNFTEIYKRSQSHHKEVIELITNVMQTERENTKKCYESVDSKVSQLLIIAGGKHV